MSHHKHEIHMEHCPKCGARLITIFDDQHDKKIKRCSKCSYRQEAKIKKLPQRE